MTTTISVGPAQLDLKLYAGDGFKLVFAFINKSTNEPFPIDGDWAAQVRAPSSAAEVLLDFDIVVADTVIISLTGEQVRTLVGVKEASWDLQQTAPGVEPKTWYKGRIVAVQDVTRDV